MGFRALLTANCGKAKPNPATSKSAQPIQRQSNTTRLTPANSKLENVLIVACVSHVPLGKGKARSPQSTKRIFVAVCSALGSVLPTHARARWRFSSHPHSARMLAHPTGSAPPNLPSASLRRIYRHFPRLDKHCIQHISQYLTLHLQWRISKVNSCDCPG